MIEQADATFQEVFSQVSLADSIKLLPFCVSSSVPLCYMSRALATTTQQDKDVPATTTASQPEGSLAPGPQAVQLIDPELHHFQYLPYQISPCRHSPLGHPFAEFLAIPTQKKQDWPSSSSLSDHCNKKTHIDSQEVEARSEGSSAQGDGDMPKLVPDVGPSFKQTTWAGTYQALFQSIQSHP